MIERGKSAESSIGGSVGLEREFGPAQQTNKRDEALSPPPVQLVSLIEFLENSDFVIRVLKPTKKQAKAIAQEAARVTKERGVFCGNDGERLPFHSNGTTIDTVAHGFEHIISAARRAEMAATISHDGKLYDKEGTFLVSLDIPGRRITLEEVESSIREFNEFMGLNS